MLKNIATHQTSVIQLNYSFMTSINLNYRWNRNSSLIYYVIDWYWIFLFHEPLFLALALSLFRFYSFSLSLSVFPFIALALSLFRSRSFPFLSVRQVKCNRFLSQTKKFKYFIHHFNSMKWFHLVFSIFNNKQSPFMPNDR